MFFFWFLPGTEEDANGSDDVATPQIANIEPKPHKQPKNDKPNPSVANALKQLDTGIKIETTPEGEDKKTVSECC